MRRSSSLLAVAGGIAVLAMLFVLWRLTRLALAPVEPGAPSAPETEAPAPEVVAPGTPAPRGVLPLPRAPIRPGEPRDPAPAADRGPDRPALDDDRPAPGTPENMTNLHFGSPQFKAQIAAVEPQLKECLQRAAATGHTPSGSASLTFILIQKPGKVVVDGTGIDADKTTLENEALVECMRDTANAMTFAGLPREAEGVVVTRLVSVERGALTENRYVTFSYLR